MHLLLSLGRPGSQIRNHIAHAAPYILSHVVIKIKQTWPARVCVKVRAITGRTLCVCVYGPDAGARTQSGPNAICWAHVRVRIWCEHLRLGAAHQPNEQNTNTVAWPVIIMLPPGNWCSISPHWTVGFLRPSETAFSDDRFADCARRRNNRQRIKVKHSPGCCRR